MTFALIAFITTAALAARLDYLGAREETPTHPYDDLLRRQRVSHLANETRRTAPRE